MAAAKIWMTGGRAIALAVLVATAGLPAAAAPVTVFMDQATVMPVARPASTIIVGNPAIADATILDNQTLVITGHSYGTTNLLILDASGQRIANELVTVVAPGQGSVTVHRRAGRQTYSCSPACAPAIAVGDNQDNFNAIDSQVRSRRGLADDSATGQSRN
jgi:Flp pilus assembly secretin CpaC